MSRYRRAVDRFAFLMARFGGSASFVLLTVAFPITWLVVGVPTRLVESAAYNFLLNSPESVLALTLTAATLYVADRIHAQQERAEEEARRRERVDAERQRRQEAQNLQLLEWVKETREAIASLERRVRR